MTISLDTLERELNLRAEWIASHYDLCKDDILKAFEKTKVMEDGQEDCGFIYLKFEPSLEEALQYLKPNVAIRAFLTMDRSVLSRWLNRTSKIFTPIVDRKLYMEEELRDNFLGQVF